MHVRASDHLDSSQDRAADLGDNYAFLDPNDNSKVVLIMSTQNFIVSSEHFGMVIFDSNLRYRFEIENTGDAIPDAFLDVTYSDDLGLDEFVTDSGQRIGNPSTFPLDHMRETEL